MLQKGRSTSKKRAERRDTDGLFFLAPFLMFPEPTGSKPCKLLSAIAGKGGLTLEVMVKPLLSIFAAIQSKATHQSAGNMRPLHSRSDGTSKSSLCLASKARPSTLRHLSFLLGNMSSALKVS